MLDNSNSRKGKKENSYCEDLQLMLNLIDQALSEPARTIIYCTCTSQPEYINGGWINIYPTTYLWNRDTGKKIQMEFAIDIPVAPKCHFYNKVGEKKQFTLIFPKVPADWTSFTLVEDSERETKIAAFDIKRNKTGVYNIVIN